METLCPRRARGEAGGPAAGRGAKPAWAVRLWGKGNTGARPQVAPALALQAGGSPSMWDTQRALSGHKASLGIGSHTVPTALPQAQVNQDPGTGGLAAVTRCVREPSYTLSLRLPNSCSETHQDFVHGLSAPRARTDEQSPVSSRWFLLTSATVSPALPPVTWLCLLLTPPTPEALTVPHPSQGSTIYVPSRSGHLLALEVTSRLSGHTGFRLGHPDIGASKPPPRASADPGWAC